MQSMSICYNLSDLIQVYLVSKAQLRTANKQFSNTNNDYEMNFSADTKITPCDDSESSSVPSMQFSFVSVEDLATQAVGSLVGKPVYTRQSYLSYHISPVPLYVYVFIGLT